MMFLSRSASLDLLHLKGLHLADNEGVKLSSIEPPQRLICDMPLSYR